LQYYTYSATPGNLNHNIPAKTPAPNPKPMNPFRNSQALPPNSIVPAAPVNFILPPVIFMLPVPDFPRIPPDGIAITDPSDIDILASTEAELAVLVVIESSVFHSMVTAPQEGVAIGTMLGADMMLGLLD
jgi:hypothetical protein